MATIITIPDGIRVKDQTLSQVRKDVTFAEGQTGNSETAVFAPPRWRTSMSSIDTLTPRMMSAWTYVLLALEGKINRLAVYDFMRPTPSGDYLGSPVLANPAAAGDSSFTLNNPGFGGKSLQRGDYLGVLQTGANRQVLYVKDDVTANGSGQMVVNFMPYLRTALPAGAQVVWDKPTWLGMLTNDSEWRSSTVVQGGMTLDFTEYWLA